MKRSIIIAIVLGIIVILAVIVGIFLIMQKLNTIIPINRVQTSVSPNTRTIINLQQGSSIEPITLDLGTVGPNTFGVFCTPSIPLIVGKAGTYTFYLVNTQDLENDFPDFIFNITVNNKNVTLGWFTIFGFKQYYTTGSIYLLPGEYNLSITLVYDSSLSVNSTNFNLPVIELGYGSTIYKLVDIELSLNNQTPQIKLQTNPSIINTTTLNLGTIKSFNSGSATDLTVIQINKGGYYTFYLLNFPEIENDFLKFEITLEISNKTTSNELVFGEGILLDFITLGASYQKYTIYLSPGRYSLYISLQYYSIYDGSEPVTFNNTMIGLGYGSTVYPLLNVSFTLQPSQFILAPEEVSPMSVHSSISPITTILTLSGEGHTLGLGYSPIVEMRKSTLTM
mgnify:CR=1 FL=1